MINFVVAVAAAFGLIVISIFIAHVAYASYQLRNTPQRLYRGNPEDFEWHIFVPALNEESVIGETISKLATVEPKAHIWVIDDNSDDATRRIVEEKTTNPYVHLVHRSAEIARTGKGDALNYAYHTLLKWRRAGNAIKADTKTVVGVVDADGRLIPEVFDVLSGSNGFGDIQVGAVQQDVWMLNADDKNPLPGQSSFRNKFGSMLLKLQDIEFRTAIAGIQNSRHKTASVSMGGNGQWTRLKALIEISAIDAETQEIAVGNPWHGSLLEDFELGVHIMLAGWKTKFLPGLWVAQEALPDIRRYIRQRTRWTQGTMQCAQYFPRLWKGKYIGSWALLELLYYLMQPWLWIVGTFLFPIPLYDVAQSFVASPSNWMNWVINDYGWMWVLMFWLVALGPLMSWGLTYRKVFVDPNKTSWKVTSSGEEHLVHTHGSKLDLGWFNALFYGFMYVWLVQLSYVIAWKAFFRLLRGRNGWAKTTRNKEKNENKNFIETETKNPFSSENSRPALKN